MNKTTKLLCVILSVATLALSANVNAKGGDKPPPPPPAPPAVNIPLEATLAPTGAVFRCGARTAVSGDTAVSLCFAYTPTGAVGAAYVFQRTGTIWKQQAKLGVDTSDLIAEYNGHVAISGNTIALSAESLTVPGNSAVYVFQRSTSATGVVTWTRQAKILSRANGDGFGASSTAFGGSSNGGFALEGDTLAVGARVSDTTSGNDAGAVYVFKRSLNAWTQTAKLSGSIPNELFGGSVALSNGTLAVGSRGATNGFDYVSSFSIFQNPTGTTTWNQQAKINTPSSSSLGVMVDIDGDTLLVSTPSFFSSFAYIYQRAGTVWSQQARLVPLGVSVNTNFNGFGSTTSLKGNIAAVGMPSTGSKTGRVFLYSRAGSTWTQKASLTDPNTAELPLYGNSIDINGNTLIVGSPAGSFGFVNLKGSSLVYRLPAF
ncbi:MAG: hypothetical protein HOO93_02875 [Methyloglobulus sp.]|nr:hypothetical protein [Methyloglobulus sp.]